MNHAETHYRRSRAKTDHKTKERRTRITIDIGIQQETFRREHIERFITEINNATAYTHPLRLARMMGGTKPRATLWQSIRSFLRW